MLIGLTGPMGSGKTTVLEVLKKLDYQYVTLSDMIREEADRRGIRQERENMMNIGQNLREEFGAGVLAERALQKAKKSGGGNWVIDGIRNPAEVEILKKNPDFEQLTLDIPDGRGVRLLLM